MEKDFQLQSTVNWIGVDTFISTRTGTSDHFNAISSRRQHGPCPATHD